MASGTPSELATSEMPVSDVDGEATPVPSPPAFPPYPPYATEPAPPSVADTIIAGHDLRLQHKSIPRRPVRPPPKPARPRGPKATDVKMTKRALRAHARCLRRHGAILTDRLERMSKPMRRNIIYLWREHAYTLPPETIARLRAMLDADEPFKPDQAYEYFINLRKTKKRLAANERVNEIKKDMLAMCTEKRFLWARNATVAFARGIQLRLSRPGRYALADGMLRLSNIILDEICGYMHTRTPSRRSSNPKSRFMMEMADKIAVWIDEILSESDNRMLMMDFDEDDDILLGPDGGGDASFADDFLNMMGDGAGGAGGLLSTSGPSHAKFTGKMKEAFDILTDAMDSKGDENLITHGKFDQTFAEGANTLRHADNLIGSTEFSTKVADDIKKKLKKATENITPRPVARAMKAMVDICSNHLAQNAEFNKEKGPAFRMLVDAMRNKPNEKMYQKDKVQRSYAQAAAQLDKAKGLESDHDDPNLSQEIHSAMTKLVDNVTPDELKEDMKETVDDCSKYLSQKAVDDSERGPAFDLLVKELNRAGGEPFSDYPALSNKNAAAYTLTSAPGLTNVTPDPTTAKEFKDALHKAVDTATPKAMVGEMKEVIDRCGDYMSAFIRDRGPAMKALIEMMDSKPDSVFAARNNYTMDYKTAAEETLNAPTIVPHLPVKDIAEEGKAHLTKDMKDVTPPGLAAPVKTLIQDVSKYLSQPVAMRSGAAGKGYAMNFLAAVKKSLGTKPLFKYKSYGQTYSDAAEEIQHAGPLESAVNLMSRMNLQGSDENLLSRLNLASQQMLTSQEELGKSTVDLGHEIASEMKKGVPTQLAPTIAEGLQPAMDKAAKHLAKVGTGKGKAMEHLVDMMKEKGETPLENLQGYDQTYSDGARRLENTASLANEKVDKKAYESVKSKLTQMAKEKKPENARVAEQMPAIVEESAKFLSAPVPETPLEKRKVLGDLMARKEDKILDEEGIYKMTYKEGGEEIKNAPVGVTKSHDEGKKKEMIKKMEEVIPDKKMTALLKDSTKEGAAHLTDAVKGRGEAMEVIQESLKNEKEKEFIDVGAFKKTHEEVADMLAQAPNLSSDKPSPVILEKVEHQVAVLPKEIPPEKTLAKEHMADATKIAAKYVADVATKESGLDPKELAALDAAGFNADAKAAAEGRRLAAVEGGASKKIADASVDGRTKDSGAEGAGAADEEGGAGSKKRRSGKGVGAEGEEGDDDEEGGPGAKKRRSAKKSGAGGAEAEGVDDEDGTGAKKRSAKKASAGEHEAKEGGADEDGTDGKKHSDKKAGVGFEDEGTAGAKKTGVGGSGAEEGGGTGTGAGGKAGTVGADGKSPGAVDADGVGAKTSAGQQPGSAGQGPGGTAYGPDGLPLGPGLTGPEYGPGGTGYGPGGEAYGPGGAAYGPDGVVYGPDGTAYGPDGRPIGPDGRAIGPDGKPYGPRGTAYRPDYHLGGVTYGVGTYGHGPGGLPDYGPGGETEEQRRRRLAEAEAYRRYEEEERRRLGDKEYFRQQAERFKQAMQAGGTGKYRGGALGADYDPEHEAALDILHRELQARGTEVFYQQPQTKLTHVQASEWLAMPVPMKVDKTVRESSDTARLYKKFERKLNTIVSRVTSPDMYDCMQDVVIESARRLSEYFVATNYNAHVNDALISEMQKKGNEILTKVDGAAETFFFAAQRLKKASTLFAHEPCYQVSHQLSKKLEEVIRARPLARKLTGIMKDHVKESSNYLSALVTKPDDQIEAYIAMLAEMEAEGDANLIEGNIPKTFKEAAAYLRQLTSFEDKINRPNSSMQRVIQNELKNLMSNVPPSGYSPTVMDNVIAESAGLLVSYIMLQGEKTEALKVLVREIKQAGDGVLLRHGPIRKSYMEGADLLDGKNADQLSVPAADPVVERKIQIKLNNLMIAKTPEEYEAIMDDVVDDATKYLAIHLLQPKFTKVCKCYKNVFVQCELWSDEILRRVERPSCTCSRHVVSTQALQDLAPSQRLRVSPGNSRVFAPGIEISFTSCPSKQTRTPRYGGTPEPLGECPAPEPTPGCLHGPTTSYLLYSTSHKRFGYDAISRQPSTSGSSESRPCSSASSTKTIPIPIQTKLSSPVKSLLLDIHSENLHIFQQQQEQLQSLEAEKYKASDDVSPSAYTQSSNYNTSPSATSHDPQGLSPVLSNVQMSETSPKLSRAKSAYSSRTPIITTDQMADWHAMMVSLMWNVQAWREWIQEIIDRALMYQHTGEDTTDWSTFNRRVSTEGLQWRQYSMFSRQLTTRLILRYKDKEIMSPKRVTVKTKTYLDCQEEMLEIINMFNRWTQWLILAVKETDSLQHNSGLDVDLHKMRWNHLKKKVEGYSKDWVKYNTHLKVSWEQKYSVVIAEYLPTLKEPGPVWVVSACGAVPSGAVAAGVYDGEVIWVARTTHNCNVMPAALYPSKHCCMVYAEGGVHRYTKYQVMCNAEVRWVAWRGGSIGGRAVRVASGVHVGRVHYRGDHLLGAVHEPHFRCHVVIFGRPFAFNCYELLMLAGDDD